MQFIKSSSIYLLITAIWMKFDSIADVLVPTYFCALFQKSCAYIQGFLLLHVRKKKQPLVNKPETCVVISCRISDVNPIDSTHHIWLIGSALKGSLNQSVPETREVNMWGLHLISYNLRYQRWYSLNSKSWIIDWHSHKIHTRWTQNKYSKSTK